MKWTELDWIGVSTLHSNYEYCYRLLKRWTKVMSANCWVM